MPSVRIKLDFVCLAFHQQDIGIKLDFVYLSFHQHDIGIILDSVFLAFHQQDIGILLKAIADQLSLVAKEVHLCLQSRKSDDSDLAPCFGLG